MAAPPLRGDNDGLLGPLRGHGVGRDEAGGGAGNGRAGPGGARAAAVLVVAWLGSLAAVVLWLPRSIYGFAAVTSDRRIIISFGYHQTIQNKCSEAFNYSKECSAAFEQQYKF